MDVIFIHMIIGSMGGEEIMKEREREEKKTQDSALEDSHTQRVGEE